MKPICSNAIHLRSGIVAGLLIAASCVRADVAPDPLSGGRTLTPYGGRSAQVSMVEETVRLRVSPKWCNVDVDFWMKNITGKTAKLQVGFPADYPKELQDFRAAVAGRQVKVADETSSRTIGTGEYSRRRRTYWKVWEMTFPAGRTVPIKVSYRTKLSGTYSWVLPQTSGSVDTALIRKASVEDRKALGTRLVSRDIRYILRSGQGWAGPIGKCHVEVTFVDGLTTGNLVLGYPRSLPKGSKLTKDRLSWTLTNFEPRTDIYFQVTPFINQTETRKLLEDFLRKSPHDPQLTDYLAKYLQAAGETDRQQKLYVELLKAWETKIALWGPESADEVLLRDSRNMFSLIRRITGAYGPSPAPQPNELARSIERIMQRVSNQTKLASSDDRFVKLFNPQIAEVLDWCRRQKQSGQAGSS